LKFTVKRRQMRRQNVWRTISPGWTRWSLRHSKSSSSRYQMMVRPRLWKMVVQQMWLRGTEVPPALWVSTVVIMTPIGSPIKLRRLSGCHILSRGEYILPTPFLRRCWQKTQVNTKTRCRERCFLGSYFRFTKRKQHLTTSRMPQILHRYSYRLH